jgi:hypothetical protein
MTLAHDLSYCNPSSWDEIPPPGGGIRFIMVDPLHPKIVPPPFDGCAHLLLADLSHPDGIAMVRFFRPDAELLIARGRFVMLIVSDAIRVDNCSFGVRAFGLASEEEWLEAGAHPIAEVLQELPETRCIVLVPACSPELCERLQKRQIQATAEIYALAQQGGAS